MTLSFAAPADIPALNRLINSAYRGETSRQGWTTEADLLDGVRTDEKSLQALLAEPGSVMLVIRDESGMPTGCVHLQKEPTAFYLGMLTVCPRLQSTGIGKQLLQLAEQYVRDNGGQRISITVISLRHELITWYERHGYTKTGETKPFPDDPAFGIPKQHLSFVVMNKKIRG